MISTSVIVAAIGLVLYVAFTRPKLSEPTVAEIGRLMFAVGLLAALMLRVI